MEANMIELPSAASPASWLIKSSTPEGQRARLMDNARSGSSEKSNRVFNSNLNDFCRFLVGAYPDGEASATLPTAAEAIQYLALDHRALSEDQKREKEVVLGALRAEACSLLISISHGEANVLIMDYLQYLTAKTGKRPSRFASKTVDSRLSTVRRAVTMGRRAGLVSWSIDVPGVHGRAERDTSGPTIEEFRRLLAATGGDTPKAKRDRAILWLLALPGLRRFEVSSLDREHVRDGCRSVYALQKKRKGRSWLQLPPSTRLALAEWLAVRGDEPGPLFTSFNRAGQVGDGLTPEGVWYVVHSTADVAFGKGHHPAGARPHGFRHLLGSIAAVDLKMKGLEVAAGLRHSNLATSEVYIQERQELAGDVWKDVDAFISAAWARADAAAV